MDEVEAPRPIARLALPALAGVLIAGTLGAILLAGGAADPPRAGALQWTVEATLSGCLDAASLVLPDLAPSVTLELAAELQNDAPAFASWGLWLESPASGPRWEVLPPGYYRHGGQTIPFHHVRAGPNELRLDLSGGRYLLYLNRERADEGEISAGARLWGLFGGAGICWTRAAVYAISPVVLPG